jgi:hypothetical protein
MASKNDLSTLPGPAIPWGRKVEDRLKKVEDTLNIATTTLDGLGSRVNQTVYASFEYGQNIANATTGRVELSVPCEVQYVSGTGLFEVTVTLAGLVQYGGVLGLGFEGTLWPYETYFDIPSNGVVASCAVDDSRWVPFAYSRSTVVSARPGVYNLALYLHANMTNNAQSVGYLNKAQLVVKAV